MNRSEIFAGYSSCVAAGDNGYTYIYSDATLDTYKKCCEALKEAKLELYTETQFNGTDSEEFKNYFATFVSEEDRVDIEYHAVDSRIYVNVTPMSASVLPLKEAPAYTAVGEKYPTIFTQVGHEDIYDCSNLCIIIRIADGSFIVIDGGVASDGVAERIYETLVKQAPDPDNIVISAWFITHADWDHAAGYLSFVRKYKGAKNINLKQFVANYPDPSLLTGNDIGLESRQNATKTEAHFLGNDVKFLKPHTGNVLYYADVKINVLYTQEDYLFRGTKFGNYNASSLVLQMITSDGTKVLIGGDHPVDGIYEGYEWCDGAIYRWYGNFIESDVCTTFHHGYGGGADEKGVVYTKIKPRIVLWTVTESRIEKDDLTNRTRNKYFTKPSEGVDVKYYVAGDNVQVLSFADGRANVTEYDTFGEYLNG